MYGFVITTAGEGLLARAAAGETLTLTGVKFGSGVVASAAAAKALTALISEQAAGTSSTPAVSGGQLSLIAEYRNDLSGGLAAGFTLAEFGVFAKVGDDTPTLLYYAALGDKAQAVQPYSEGLDVHRFPVAVAVTGDVNVTLSYPASAWVTSAQLEEALGEIDLSGYLKTNQVGAANGAASLDESGKVPSDQLPEMNYAPASHASQHASGGSDEITPASIGAVSKSGDTMTGFLTVPNLISVSNGRIEDWGLGELNFRIIDRNGGASRYICLLDETKELNFNNSLNFVQEYNGTYNVQRVLHTGNAQALGFPKIASGSYVGTSGNLPSLILSGIPKLLIITSISNYVNYEWNPQELAFGIFNLNGITELSTLDSNDFKLCAVSFSSDGSIYYGSTYGAPLHKRAALKAAYYNGALYWSLVAQSDNGTSDQYYPLLNYSGVTYHWVAIY